MTGGAKGLQKVTGGHNGLQGVTKDYRNLFLTRTFPILFLGLFCIKIKVEEISTFDQNDGLTLLKNSNFAFFVNSSFYSL